MKCDCPGDIQLWDLQVLSNLKGSPHKKKKTSPLFPVRSGTQIFGGDGDDSLFGSGSDTEDECQPSGNDSLHGENGNDYLAAGDGNDYLFGDAGDDILHGGKGDDNLCGGDGNDDLIGHQGSDIIVGGPGNDFFAAGLGDHGNRLKAICTYFVSLLRCGRFFAALFAPQSPSSHEQCSGLTQIPEIFLQKSLHSGAAWIISLSNDRQPTMTSG